MTKPHAPLYLINSNIISNGLPARLVPAAISEIMVYKRHDEPPLLRDLSSTGIVAVTCNAKIASKSFAEIGQQYHVSSPFRVMLNGHPLNTAQQAELRIMPDAIGQVRIIPASTENAAATLTIQVADFTAEKQQHAPGTIMIR